MRIKSKCTQGKKIVKVCCQIKKSQPLSLYDNKWIIKFNFWHSMISCLIKKSWPLSLYDITTAHPWYGDHFTSINACRVSGQESGFKSLEGSFTHTHIHLKQKKPIWY